jgi:hypothetical protein
MRGDERRNGFQRFISTAHRLRGMRATLPLLTTPDGVLVRVWRAQENR